MSFERITKNDFTIEELEHEVVNGQSETSDLVKREGYQEEYDAWSAKRPTGFGPEYSKWVDSSPKDPYVKDEEGNYVHANHRLVDRNEYGWSWDELGYIHGLGNFESIVEWSLGDGQEMGIVFKHVESGRIFRKTGTYSSWDSNSWDYTPVEEVAPVQVSVVRFTPIDKEYVYENPTVDNFTISV